MPDDRSYRVLRRLTPNDREAATTWHDLGLWPGATAEAAIDAALREANFGDVPASGFARSGEPIRLVAVAESKWHERDAAGQMVPTFTIGLPADADGQERIA